MLSVAEMLKWDDTTAIIQHLYKTTKLEEKIEVNCEQNMIKMEEAITSIPDGHPEAILHTVPQ